MRDGYGRHQLALERWECSVAVWGACKRMGLHLMPWTRDKDRDSQLALGSIWRVS